MAVRVLLWRQLDCAAPDDGRSRAVQRALEHVVSAITLLARPPNCAIDMNTGFNDASVR
jgi:hypothetical protein